MHVPFSYLDRQFAEVDNYLADIRELVLSGDFTLGKDVQAFETAFAELCGMPYAVGVGSGTDALGLSLKMLGVGPGDEVITTPMTFFATVGAIVMTGATPVFVDSESGFVIDPEKIEAAITPRTKALLPVHYTGNLANMPRIAEIAQKHGLKVVEDACQSIAGQIDGLPAGTWSDAAGYSLHPLKNLNVWGDAGVITTRSAELAETLRRYRNHGMINRDQIAIWGVNSRLDSLQAVVGRRLIGDTAWITEKRISHAQFYDQALASLAPQVQIPPRRAGVRHVFHLYLLRVERRDELLAFLNQRGIEAKVHYPIPLHLQPAAAALGYKAGDFPVCEADCKQIITLPAHQHLSQAELDYTVEQIQTFYAC
ncbi:MAG: DegT/DnrJ/EryC1/StrS family aminotransferase [Candidatus Sericytochromatia bacterium]|nr:DegT/DnrJ/EryC1/StrS family aminotransferase [Candidatus Sericytochromatia bacterium]